MRSVGLAVKIVLRSSLRRTMRSSCEDDRLEAAAAVAAGCGGEAGTWYADRDPYNWALGISGPQALVHGREFIAKQLIERNPV